MESQYDELIPIVSPRSWTQIPLQQPRTCGPQESSEFVLTKLPQLLQLALETPGKAPRVALQELLESLEIPLHNAGDVYRILVAPGLADETVVPLDGSPYSGARRDIETLRERARLEHEAQSHAAHLTASEEWTPPRIGTRFLPFFTGAWILTSICHVWENTLGYTKHVEAFLNGNPVSYVWLSITATGTVHLESWRWEHLGPLRVRLVGTSGGGGKRVAIPLHRKGLEHRCMPCVNEYATALEIQRVSPRGIARYRVVATQSTYSYVVFLGKQIVLPALRGSDTERRVSALMEVVYNERRAQSGERQAPSPVVYRVHK